MLDKLKKLIKQTEVYLAHFPNHQKYALTQRIRNSLYDMYGYFVEAQKRFHKKTVLTNLDVEHERFRMLINLAFDLGLFEFKSGKIDRPVNDSLRRYSYLSTMIDEIGKMIGGWLHSIHQQTKAAH